MEATGYKFTTFLSHPIPTGWLFLQGTPKTQADTQSLLVAP